MFENRSEFKSGKYSKKNVITKDSMLRFGDDLTELILSYLTLEDKIRPRMCGLNNGRDVYSINNSD